MKPKYSDPILFCLSVTVITVLFVKSLAIDNAEKIKAGDFDQYTVSLPNSINEQAIALLGTSSRFSYFYDVISMESIVLPVESIAYMIKKQPKEKLKINENE